MRIKLEECNAYLLSVDDPKYEANRAHSLREAAKYGIKPKWFRAEKEMTAKRSQALSILQICTETMDDERPLLFLEDDICSWNPNTEFDIPDDADIFMIGLTTYVYDEQGEFGVKDKQHDGPSIFEKVSSDLYRSRGILSAHSIILTTRRAKEAWIRSCQYVLNRIMHSHDQELARRTQEDLVQYTLAWPVFYQDKVLSRYNMSWTKRSITDSSFHFNEIPRDAVFVSKQELCRDHLRVVHSRQVIFRVHDFVIDETAHKYSKGTLAHIPADIESKTEMFGPITQKQFPKIVHHIWVGQNKMPQLQMDCIENWKALHPDWTFILWTNEHLTRENFWLYDLICEAPSYAQKADIMRIEILLKLGGLYVDTDFDCYMSVNPLLQLADALHKNIIVSSEYGFDTDYVTNAFIMCKPGCSGLKAMVDHWRREGIDFSKRITDTTGPYLFGRYCLMDPFLFVHNKYIYPYGPHTKDDSKWTDEYLIEMGCIASHKWAKQW